MIKAVLAVLLLAAALPGEAKDIRFSPEGGGDYLKLLTALRAAAPGDVIVIRKKDGQVGMSLKQEGKALLVADVLSGSPAEAAGIKPGERLIAVDGEDAGSMTLTEAVGKVRGLIDTAVTLKIASADGSSRREVPITRGPIRMAVKNDASKLEIARAVNDLEAAAALAPALAEAGDVEAQNYMAFASYNGWGMNKSRKDAVKWAQKAAEAGHLASERLLGVMYAMGEGVDKDWPEAVKWIRKAADKGDAPSIMNMSVAYENGWTGLRDLSAALRWARWAADPEAFNQSPENVTKAQNTVARLERLVGARETASDKTAPAPWKTNLQKKEGAK